MRKSFVVLALFFASVLATRAAKADSDTCSAVAGNLVTNCGFETDDFTDWSGTSTANGNSGVGPDFSYSGSSSAYLGSVDATATLSQTLSTVAGTTYTIQFALDNEGDAAPLEYTNSFLVDFGSDAIFSETNAIGDSYVLYTLTGVATSSSTNLVFTSENDAYYWDLDSVSVVAQPSAAPEPSSLILLGTGIIGCVGAVRRRFNN